MPIYPEPPWSEGFESLAIGAAPPRGQVIGETAAATIRVSDERAATGSHSLKFQDAAGLDYSYNPHLFYSPGLRSGEVTGSFAARLGTGAILYHEWRWWGADPYQSGPSLVVDASGILTASGLQLPITIPRDTWVTFTLRAPIGPGASGLYEVAVEVPGNGVQVFSSLGAATGGLCALQWFGFVALADADAVLYLDDIALSSR